MDKDLKPLLPGMHLGCHPEPDDLVPPPCPAPRGHGEPQYCPRHDVLPAPPHHHHHHHPFPCEPHHHHCHPGEVAPFGPHGPVVPVGPQIIPDKDGKFKVNVNLFETPGTTTIVKNYYTEKTEEQADSEDPDIPGQAVPEEWPIEVMYHKKTGLPFYPKACTKGTFDEDGNNVDSLLAAIHDRIDVKVIPVEMYFNEQGTRVLTLPEDYDQAWVDAIDKGIHLYTEDGTVDKVIFLDRYKFDPESEAYKWYFMDEDFCIVIGGAARGATYIEGAGPGLVIDDHFDKNSANAIQNGVVANKFEEIDNKLANAKVKDVQVNGTSVVDAAGIANILLSGLIVCLTDAEYAALTPDPKTLYLLKQNDASGNPYIHKMYYGTIPFGTNDNPFILDSSHLDGPDHI